MDIGAFSGFASYDQFLACRCEADNNRRRAGHRRHSARGNDGDAKLHHLGALVPVHLGGAGGCGLPVSDSGRRRDHAHVPGLSTVG